MYVGHSSETFDTNSFVVVCLRQVPTYSITRMCTNVPIVCVMIRGQSIPYSPMIWTDPCKAGESESLIFAHA